MATPTKSAEKCFLERNERQNSSSKLKVTENVKPSKNRRVSLSHFTSCNKGIHHQHEIEKSQSQFDWKVCDLEDDNDWSKWHDFGLDVQYDFMDIDWKNLCDMEFSWTGICKMKPGSYLPLHIHDPPETYYILKGEPTVVLNGIWNRCRPIQCVTIPPRCPHKIFNDTDAEVIFIYTYLPLNDICTKDQLNWVFLEDTTLNKSLEDTTKAYQKLTTKDSEDSDTDSGTGGNSNSP